MKLGKLPDRVPVKLTVMISPDLHQALTDYADLYASTYGTREPVSDLVPAMLASFLDNDRDFARQRR